MKKSKFIAFLGLSLFLLFSVQTFAQSKKWDAPATAKETKNPTKSDNASLAIGKTLYAKHCQACHGKQGLGDGPKADSVEGDLNDFSTAEFQAQTDGELFYKITNGNGDMPKFKVKLPDDEDRWLIINYVRTLAE